jgi:glycosyltransferase involved in cell wall biosynthesis
MSRCSAIVLTLNEETNLERCFASLRWCDEIVVIDSGSKDQTRERAVELGARVLVHEQPPPFKIDEQRNWALDNAQLPLDSWALFLDADEVVPVALAKAIRDVSSAPRATFKAYELTPRYLFWGTWLKRTQGFPNWHPRLVCVGHARFQGGVWEHFSVGTRVGRIDVPYDHFANSKGFSDWLQRHDRYSSWDAARVHEFLEYGNSERLGTTRKQRLRRLAARFWPLRPVVRFLYMYIGRLGFLEGRSSLAFCLLYGFYEYMIVVKVIELRRRSRRQPL